MTDNNFLFLARTAIMVFMIIMLGLAVLANASDDEEKFTILVEGVGEIDSKDLCENIKNGISSEGLDIECQP